MFIFSLWNMEKDFWYLIVFGNSKDPYW